MDSLSNIGNVERLSGVKSVDGRRPFSDCAPEFRSYPPLISLDVSVLSLEFPVSACDTALPFGVPSQMEAEMYERRSAISQQEKVPVACNNTTPALPLYTIYRRSTAGDGWQKRDGAKWGGKNSKEQNGAL